MRLPRDLSGRVLAKLLRRYGYEVVRQEASHFRPTSTLKGIPHHITIPDHSESKIGTLRKIIRRVAEYLELDPSALMGDLFQR